MDLAYRPPEIESRQVYGISLQQMRNNAKIDAALFTNIVSKNKDVRRLLPYTHLLMLCTAPIVRCDGPDRRDALPEIHAVEQRRIRLPRRARGRRRGAAIAHPLHAACRRQG